MLKLATKLAPHLPALETAYRAGFRYAELWLDEALLADWRGVLERARHYPNGYALHFPNRGALTPEAVQGCVELYRGLDCRCLVIHRPMFERHAAELLRLEPALQLAIENHKLAPAQFAEWAERSPGLTLDVEHVWMFTHPGVPLAELVAQVRAFLERWGEKLRHVHLPGYWPGRAEHRPMYCGRDLVFAILSLLSEFRFEGLIVSEVEQEYQIFAELHMDVLLFEAWRQRHDPRLRG
jgi:hypothetical protein